MANGENLLFGGGGINQEDGSINFPGSSGGISPYSQGDYPYALNTRIGASLGTNSGAVENMPGTLEITDYNVWNGSDWISGSPAAGTNEAINKYEDRSEGKVYWFVKNSNGDDSILMYNKVERKIYEILKWDKLNFSNFISVTKINKYLIFTDGNPSDLTGNPPRIVDVTTIYTLFNTLGSQFSEYHISFAKWPPISPPTVEHGTDGNVFIKKGIYQFCYRYIYKGGFRSTWSPPSNFVSNELVTFINDNNNPSPAHNQSYNFVVTAPGFIFDYNNPDNTSFQHSDPRFYYFVEFIEYAYRDSVVGNWKIFNRLKINDSIPSSVTFENSGPITNVSDSDIGQYYDAVPLLSRSVEAIDNRPMFANNLDDLSPMSDFAVTNVEVYSVQPTDNNWFYNVEGFGYSLVEKFKTARFSFKENGIYKLGIIFKHYDGRSGLVQTLDNWTYTIPVNNAKNSIAQEDFHALGFKIADGLIPPDWAVDYQVVRSNCLNIEKFIVGQVNEINLLQYDTTNNNVLSTSTAIQDAISGYYNNFSTGGAQYSLSSRILQVIRECKLVVYENASLIYFDISNWSLDSRFFADIIPIPGSLPDITIASNNPPNNIYYNWEPGDRVRFWGSATSDFSGPYTQFDEEIISFVGNGLIVMRPDNLNSIYDRYSVQYASSDDKPNRLYNIEVYRPTKYAKDNDVIYYEMGEWYPVLKPTTADRTFSKTDFTWSGSASVTKNTINGFSYYDKLPIINGDVWLVLKNFYWSPVRDQREDHLISQGILHDGVIVRYGLITSGALGPYVTLGSYPKWSTINDYPIFPQMNQDITNAAGFWEHNTGRPLAAYKYIPKQFDKSTQVRFGGKFLEDSLFIGINNFQDQNQYIYPSEYGKIRAMVNVSNTQVKAVGNILLVIGEEETWSVYVNRTTLEDLSGRSQVSLSDKVLGSFNTLLGSYGTLNPESVSKKNSRVLFWNQKRGMWIRYSDDGLTSISDVKMQNWFKDMSILMQPSFATDTPAKALSVFDPYYEEWITYLNHSDLPSTFRGYSSYKCVTFSERAGDKRWKSFHDYAPELMAEIENETYLINGTTVSILFAGTDYNTFQGEKKDSMIQFYANDEMRKMKVWKALGMLSTDKWSVPSIDGDFRSNSVTAQNSEILLTDWEQKEEMFWADIKRDLNTINAANPDQAIVNGDPMRSRALKLMFKLDPSVTWYSLLYWIAVKYDISEMTIKK